MNHTILKELEVELKNYFKPFLNAPATIEEIQYAESEMGISFPDELRNLYLAHNGEVKSGPGLFFGLPFLSLDEVLDEWRVWKSIEDDAFFNFDAFSIPTECIKESYVNRNWIPISKDYGGNNIGIDVDPGEKGKVGQVINFGRDEEVKYVIANRISDLLLFILQKLKNKDFTIHQEEDYLYWSYGANDNIHFLDALFNIELPVLHPQFIFQSEKNVKGWYDSLDENWKDIVGTSERADKFIREKRLYLGGNELIDISPLQMCTEVRELILSGNEIKDLTGLERMNSLKKLYLVNNPVQDLTPILHLQHLEEMNMKKTNVNNLSALVEMPSLKKLDISHTSIQDFSLLTQFKKLESLTVHISNREQLYAISKVDNLKHLHILGLENVSELDLLVLQNLNKLITIEFENSIIANLNCFEHNASIQNIKLTDTKVKDGAALGKMKGIKELELDGATIDNLETICCSHSLEIFTGSFEQFYMLKDSFDRKIDFSKVIGGMSEEESEIWHQHVMS
ncbi:SMI1/KNR4 family protein [Bacillus cereus]|uniref:SMI1/KNR4 family protein n=1 Tax=Bacillus luti TaxID=2026191 RepID=A0ABU8HVU4_9BACI|nr:SMI1/KNR4 family protein [Bacillus luti]RGN75592.1 SMI1/KNR4 family protein [Bacillus cereus]